MFISVGDYYTIEIGIFQLFFLYGKYKIIINGFFSFAHMQKQSLLCNKAFRLPGKVSAEGLRMRGSAEYVETQEQMKPTLRVEQTLYKSNFHYIPKGVLSEIII